MSKTKIDERSSEDAGAERKRKRSKEDSNEEGGLEIDVNLPEPPSKKARRKAQKAEEKKAKRLKDASAPVEAAKVVSGAIIDNSAKQSASTPTAETRSPHGIWIGNLPFTTTKDDLREFLREKGGIDEERDIARLHLPNPLPGSRNPGKPAQNRGFAYIDFTTAEVLAKALALSETLLSGRKVLIKDAKNFEGRPAKPAAGEEGKTPEGGKAKKEPSKRVFVGNLGFDVTREDLIEHFSQAGEVDDVFLASFEDSGKCKGFGWVRFSSIKAAGNAVRGFIYKDPEDADDEKEDDEDGDDDEVEIITEKKSKPKREKHFINRLHGRQLRCEFAEDAQTRYKKRYGKPPRDSTKNPTSAPAFAPQPDPLDRTLDEADLRTATQQPKPTEGRVPRVARSQTEHRRERRSDKEGKPERKPRGDKEGRREERRKRHDARTIAPGQALAFTQRASGAIVEGQGKKTSFD